MRCRKDVRTLFSSSTIINFNDSTGVYKVKEEIPFQKIVYEANKYHFRYTDKIPQEAIIQHSELDQADKILDNSNSENSVDLIPSGTLAREWQFEKIKKGILDNKIQTFEKSQLYIWTKNELDFKQNKRLLSLL